MDEYITINQAASILGVSEQTIRNFLLNKKYFNGKRFGRQLQIEKHSFLEYIERSKIS